MDKLLCVYVVVVSRDSRDFWIPSHNFWSHHHPALFATINNLLILTPFLTALWIAHPLHFRLGNLCVPLNSVKFISINQQRIHVSTLLHYLTLVFVFSKTKKDCPTNKFRVLKNRCEYYRISQRWSRWEKGWE